MHGFAAVSGDLAGNFGLGLAIKSYHDYVSLHLPWYVFANGRELWHLLALDYSNHTQDLPVSTTAYPLS